MNAIKKTLTKLEVVIPTMWFGVIVLVAAVLH